MKNIAILITTILIAILLSSCNTQKALQKAINKNGQRESVAYVVAKYPEYFINTEKTDTIRDTIKVVVEKITHDTIIKLDSTFFFENKDLKLILVRLSNGKIKVRAEIKEKVILKPYEKVVKLYIPCPDVLKLQIPVKETKMQFLYKVMSWFSWIVILLFILFKIFLQRFIKGLPGNW
jgi:predicted small secreted protein